MPRSDTARGNQLERILAAAPDRRRNALTTVGWPDVPGTDTASRCKAQADLGTLMLWTQHYFTCSSFKAEQAMGHAAALPARPSETTDLERRVLAHERILQALIAYMARTEPRFIDHLRERFVEPMQMARHEHDHRETDDYAEEFIRAVMLLGEARAPRQKDSKVTGEHPRSRRGTGGNGPSSSHEAQRERVEVHERNGIWKVKVDGRFRGDYHHKEPALAAAALLKLSLR